MTNIREQVAAALTAIGEGDAAASEQLLPLVYDELRAMARRHMSRQSPDHTLQATALVHEAYLRLGGQGQGWESRAHFLAVAARAMRQVLVSHARARQAQKRGGDRARVMLGDPVESPDLIDPCALDDALKKLTALDDRQARIVELRFFAGMTVEQIAHVMRLSEPTIKREWRAARAFLNAELDEGGE